MTIVATPIHNGFRFSDARFHVDVTSDARYFTIYDQSGEPCGTITRPSVMGGNRKWESHLPNG